MDAMDATEIQKQMPKLQTDDLDDSNPLHVKLVFGDAAVPLTTELARKLIGKTMWALVDEGWNQSVYKGCDKISLITKITIKSESTEFHQQMLAKFWEEEIGAPAPQVCRHSFDVDMITNFENEVVEMSVHDYIRQPDMLRTGNNGAPVYVFVQ